MTGFLGSLAAFLAAIVAKVRHERWTAAASSRARELVARWTVIAETPRGRAIVGFVDGSSRLAVETEDVVVARRDLLRSIGYEL